MLGSLGLGTQGETEEKGQAQIPERVKQVTVFHAGKYAPFGLIPPMLAAAKPTYILALIF
ncbi:hypothetical protein GCM10027511_05730 [Hymenobacter humi]